jgi:hypothetical protein
MDIYNGILLIFFIIILSLFFKKIISNYVFHIIINLIFYLSYFSVLYHTLNYKGEPDGNWIDVGLGAAFYIIFTSPFFILFNSVFIFYSFKNKLKIVLLVNIIGILFCISFIIFLYYKTNGFK